MPSGALPDTDSSVRSAELERAGAWLTRHGLVDARPTPLLAARLEARRRARSANSLMLAVLILATGLVRAYDLLTTAKFGEFQPHRWLPLQILVVLMVGLLVAQSLLDRQVRRVDRRAGAALSRRAAHLIQPGWRAVLGGPYAALAVATYAIAIALALSALTVPDSTVRYAAVIMLVGLIGVAFGIAVHLRELLTRPVVAEDEVSLMADVIMRVEDARELTRPGVVWYLPVVLLSDTTPIWWTIALIIFVLLGVVALKVVCARTPSSVTVARQAMNAR